MLERLAELIRVRNDASRAIAEHIGRPAQIGHVGDYIAARVFDIGLVASGSHKAIDGHFRSGPLAGRSVNVKWYGREESLLDLTPDCLPDDYLVMTGPRGTQAGGEDGGWTIERVFLFDARVLEDRRRERGVKIGVATSVRRAEWDTAELYPEAQNPRLVLSEGQRQRLKLFAGRRCRG